MSGRDRRTVAVDRAKTRSALTAEQDVLTAYLVLQSALSGRTSPDHAARAYRRAATSVRALVWGDICPICTRALPSRRWATFKGYPYEVAQDHVLARSRAYCSEHCAAAALVREGWSFIVDGLIPRGATHTAPPASDPNVTLPPEPHS